MRDWTLVQTTIHPFQTPGVGGANKKGHDQSCSVPTASYKRKRMGLSLS